VFTQGDDISRKNGNHRCGTGSGIDTEKTGVVNELLK